MVNNSPAMCRRNTELKINAGLCLENALKPHLDAGRKIAVWLVNPRTHLALFDCLPPGYQLKPWTADIPNGFELVRVPPAPTDGVP